MPAPANADELLDLIQRSGVVDEARLRAYIQKLTEASGIPADPQKFAGLLVRDGLLTYFQAEQLLQGKYKRFSIGKYKVLEKLGAGGMAQVFLCEHKLMRRRVAIKVLPTAKADDPSSLERFYREARAVAAVDHPNIVRAYDIDQDENLHFLVMEYVDGTNLQDLVKKFGPLDVLRSCHYIYGAAVGLQHAHEMGLVHRDIKPGNILLDRSGLVKILDMGLARFFHDEEDALTKKYDENVLGTADYLAPEQALDSHTVDIRADIYSLGATFYFLLTGSAPFPEGSVAQKLIWHQNRVPRPIKSLRPEVPDDVVAVVDRMMAKRAEDRYQTPAEVMAALAGWVATPIPPPAEREMPQISVAAGGGGSRGPGSIVATGASVASAARPASMAIMPPLPPVNTPAGSGQTPRLTPAPIATKTSEPDTQPPVWGELHAEIDTQTASAGDTGPADDVSVPKRSGRLTVSGRGSRSGSRRPGSTTTPETEPKSKKKLIIAVIGLVVLVGAGVGGVLLLGGKDNPPPPETPSNKIVVGGDGESGSPSLKDALARATPGDTILIKKPKILEALLRLDRTRHKDITIEGAVMEGGRYPVVEAAGNSQFILDITSVEGVKLKNLEFDGAGRSDVGVQITGACVGLSIEGVHVRGMRTSGFRFNNASGGDGRPILLDRVRVQITTPLQVGISLASSASVDNRRLTIRNSRVEGSGSGPGMGIGVRFEGATNDIEITGNRFFNLDSAFTFGKPPTNKIVKAAITNNTIFDAKAGLQFDLSVSPPNTPQPGSFVLSVHQNYFGKTPECGKGNGGNGPVPGLSAGDNAFGPDSNAGNVDLKAARMDNPQLPPPNPADDATFLRFPGGPPEFGGSRVKVGAP